MEIHQAKGLTLSKLQNQIGEVYGELTIIEYLWTNKQGQHRFTVQCSCGLVKEVYIHCLLSGTVKACRNPIHARLVDSTLVGVKICSKCKIEKDSKDFSKSSSTKDGLFAWCKDCHALYSKTDGKQANLDRTRKRRALILSAEGTFTQAQFNQLCASYDNKCLCCGKYSNHLTADHVIPISRGGANTIDNIQPLCKSCNSRKHRKTVDYRP